MRLLVATNITQGARSSDFDHVFGPETVQLASVCHRDGGDPDGPCGCRRAFIGIHSRRPVTTAIVVERDMTSGQYRSLLRMGYETSGYRRRYSPQDLDRLTERTAADLEQLAAELPPGAVVERRDENVLVRIFCSPFEELAGEEFVPSPHDPHYDNGFVSINIHGDDRDRTFPAWLSPRRWNGFAIPTFSRATAIQVVDWTNQLHADDPNSSAHARWDGEDVLLWESQSDKGRPVRIAPDEHGRYAIGDGWTWEEQQCWICRLPARPGEDGHAVQIHEIGCPTGIAIDQWPLAAHDLV